VDTLNIFHHFTLFYNCSYVIYNNIGDIMFETENKYYQENRDILREKYIGKAIVIVGDTVIGAYDNIGDAYKETIRVKAPGTFCLKNIPVDPNDAYIEDHPRISPIRRFVHA